MHIYLDIAGQKAVVANRDGRAVEKCAVEVGVKIFAQTGENKFKDN